MNIKTRQQQSAKPLAFTISVAKYFVRLSTFVLLVWPGIAIMTIVLAASISDRSVLPGAIKQVHQWAESGAREGIPGHVAYCDYDGAEADMQPPSHKPFEPPPFELRPCEKKFASIDAVSHEIFRYMKLGYVALVIISSLFAMFIQFLMSGLCLGKFNTATAKEGHGNV